MIVNKRALCRRLDRRMHYFGDLAQVWVTFDVPVPLPIKRWSPGPNWIEAAHGEYWIRPRPDRQHEVMVLTHDQTHMSPYEVEEFYPQALVSGVIGEDQWFGTFADKPHRIYSQGYVQRPFLRVEPVDHDHPAVRYQEMWEKLRTDFWTRCDLEFQPPGGAHSLWLSADVQIKADGSGWYLGLHALLSVEEYSADLRDLALTIDRIQRHYGSARLYIQRKEQLHLTDPLWQPAMAAIKRAEGQS